MGFFSSPSNIGSSLRSKILFSCHISLNFFNPEYFHSLCLLWYQHFWRMRLLFFWCVEKTWFCVYLVFTCFHSKQDYCTGDMSLGHQVWRHIISICSLLGKFILVTWTIIFTCRHYFFSLVINTQSLGKDLRTIKISYFSSNNFSRCIIHWWFLPDPIWTMRITK